MVALPDAVRTFTRDGRLPGLASRSAAAVIGTTTLHGLLCARALDKISFVVQPDHRSAHMSPHGCLSGIRIMPAQRIENGVVLGQPVADRLDQAGAKGEDEDI